MPLHIDTLKGAVRLSNRQYGQLHSILSEGTVKLEQLSGYNMISLGALKRRGLIEETHRKDGVRLTWDGEQTLRAFDRADFMRKVSSFHFASCLHLDVPDALFKGNSDKKRKKTKLIAHEGLSRRRRAA